jgi:hypothetical protein
VVDSQAYSRPSTLCTTARPRSRKARSRSRSRSRAAADAMCGIIKEADADGALLLPEISEVNAVVEAKVSMAEVTVAEDG